MLIVGGMTGIAVGWSSFVDTVLMATGARYTDMFSGELEGRLTMIK
jgi:hypothetical protein